ncbi:hypothetical protein F5B20DRAFT_523236 [Whalleya microplaca]|nr:hypothetical protein F5B20DRAFT_523236 [Whalleya microplaca]
MRRENKEQKISCECLTWELHYKDSYATNEKEVGVEQRVVAIPSEAIQLSEVEGWRFAEELILSFFGAGVMHMPPGSRKRTKNTRKMELVFFMHSGKVEVTVASRTFEIREGGVRLVPRGRISIHYRGQLLIDSRKFLRH